MNCIETTRLLNAHFDGELELKDSLAVDEHLHGCVRCRQSLAGLEAARVAILRHAGAPRTPETLRRDLGSVFGHAAEGRGIAMPRSPAVWAAPGVLALLLAGWLFVTGLVRAPASDARVVYHISSSETARAALRNLQNHLAAAPGTKVVVVAHGAGVDFLIEGARDEAGEPFAQAIGQFARKGVEFRVCYNTLEHRGIGASKVVGSAIVVPSGVAEIGRLQAREGYAYMRL